MDFEHRTKKVLPFGQFIGRLLRFALYSILLLGFCLGIGVLGYHYFDALGWLDAMVNASMILTGMGPVSHLDTDASKWFASGYAIFSGIAFPSVVALFLSPMVHRFFHKLHVSRDAVDRNHSRK
jgi:hypothetical protein